MINTVLQISWIFDFIPVWVGPVFIISGTMVMFLPSLIQAGWGQRETPDVNIPGVLVSVAGFLLIGMPSLIENLETVSLVAFCVGSAIQGRASTRFYQKVLDTFRNKRLPKTDSTKIIYILLSILLTLLTISVALSFLSYQLASESRPSGTITGLLILHTMFVLISSILGFSYRLHGLELDVREYEHFESTSTNILLFGAVLAFSGVEVYNFSLVGSTTMNIPFLTQIAADTTFAGIEKNLITSFYIYIIGSIFYAVGYLSGIRSIINEYRKMY